MRNVRVLIVAAAVTAASALVAGSGGTPAGAAPTVLQYEFTGTPETLVVPDGVTTIDFQICGARRRSTPIDAGGRGTLIEGALAVTPGETLIVTIGQEPVAQAGGYNGGGDGGLNGPEGGGTGGGGASDIRRGGTGLANRIIVAAGGGGSGLSGNVPGNAGGDGGDLIGGAGGDVQGGAAGLGGTQSAGGAGGVDGPSIGADGALGLGGDGDGSGSGGGGGYYGGGGGSGGNVLYTTSRIGGGGGGGSSLSQPADLVTPDRCESDGLAILSFEAQQITTTTTGPTSTTTGPTSTSTTTWPIDPISPTSNPAVPVRYDPTYAG